MKKWPAIWRLNAYCMSVSTFIFTTPYFSESSISDFSEPEPPWNTKSNGCDPSGSPSLAAATFWPSASTSGLSLTLPGL